MYALKQNVEVRSPHRSAFLRSDAGCVPVAAARAAFLGPGADPRCGLCVCPQVCPARTPEAVKTDSSAPAQ